MTIKVRQELENLLGKTYEAFEAASFNTFDDETRDVIRNCGYDIYRGKVREVLLGDKILQIVHSDRLSAFDRYIANIPFKGIILNEINSWWMKKVSNIIDTHFISKPHPRILTGKRTNPVKVEVIVRGYLAGSMLRSYKKGERNFCGQVLPEQLNDYGPLPELLITPTTKAEAFEHDENIDEATILSTGLASKEEWEFIKTKSFELFSLGQEVYNELGWILVDTKYEFGRIDDGSIILIDEIHTPDSSRLWIADTYSECLGQSLAPEMLDKENVRRYLAALGFTGEGEVPKVPEAELAKLAMVYLKVAESLLRHELEIEDSVDLLTADFYKKLLS